MCTEGIGAAFGTSLVWLMGPKGLGVQVLLGLEGNLSVLPRAAPGRQEPGSLLTTPSPRKNHVL